ncbi:MAG TPA: YihY/virulence factor BrkB family protein [Gemmatimonadales bacterium]|nr:YihY/virulence factor BrkB family protein [Gemmatimonadales bacterium]
MPRPDTPLDKQPRITLRALAGILRRALAGWWNDNVPRLGASLAYYTLFSLAPILVVAIAIGGLIFGEEAVRGEIVGQIQGMLGREGAEAVQSMLEGASRRSTSLAATAAGVVTFFLGATGAFLELQTALNAIWRVKPKDEGSFFQALVVQRLISFGLVVAMGFLLVTSLLVSAALAAVHSYMGNAFPGVGVVWEALNVVVSLGVITILFAMIYKVLPDVRLVWADVWIGGLVTAGLFTIGKLLIGMYLGTTGVASTYGAAGSVIVILVWVYYSAQIILLGAEFTREYVATFGRRPPPEPFAKKDANIPQPSGASGP